MSEHPKWPICNSARTDKILKMENKYSMFKRNKCEVVFTSPIPSDEELHDLLIKLERKK